MTPAPRPLILVSSGHDWLHNYWIRALAPPLVAAGADVRKLSDIGPPADRHEAIKVADGLVLGGGEDIAPQHYGSETSPLLGALDHERDELELPLAREAFEIGLPLLGICRGMQVMSVCLGGTMYHDAAEHPGAEDHPTGLADGFRPFQEAELAGQLFTLLNGGPRFEKNPTVSCFVELPEAGGVDLVRRALLEGGSTMMPLDAYPRERAVRVRRGRRGGADRALPDVRQRCTRSG